MTLFSIITPAFNRAELLSTMIKSVLKQTYTNWQLIIIDDGSIDNTCEKVKPFLSDSRIKYINKVNSGAAESRNVGVNNAHGDFIVFLDSDDEVYEEWLQAVALEINDDTGMVCVAAKRNFYNARCVDEPLMKIKTFGEEVSLKFTAGSMFIKRNLFQKVGGYDISLDANQHTDLGYRLMLALEETNYKVVSINKPLVIINVHEGLRIRTNWEKVLNGGLQFIDKHFDLLKKNDKKEISNIYGVIAYAYKNLNKKDQSLKYLLRAIKYNPLAFKNYYRLFKYMI